MVVERHENHKEMAKRHGILSSNFSNFDPAFSSFFADINEFTISSESSHFPQNVVNAKIAQRDSHWKSRR